MALRPQRSARMLSADSSITFDELIVYTHSTRMEAADRLLDDLLPAARASTSVGAYEAADVLDRWDRSADNASRGGVLFVEWWRELGRSTPAGKSLWAIPWSESRPRETPDGLSDPALAVAALEKAAARVKSLYGAIDVPWGDVYRLRRDTVDLPANGSLDALGVFRATGYALSTDQRYRATGGDSFIAAIEFSSPLHARSLVGYGNASRAGSRHRVDQLSYYSRKELKPVWRTRVEIEAHLEKRESF
jgi:Protein related to penicillin acylase